MTNRFSRRQILQSSLGIGVLPWLCPSSVLGQSSSQERRFVVFFTPNEPINKDYWMPRGGSGSEFPLSGAELPAPIDELSDYRSQLLMLGNMRISNPGYDHAAIGILLTGVPNEYPSGDKAQNAAIGGGISIDQLIASRFSQEPLLVGVRNGSQNGTTRLSYLGARRPVTPFGNPTETFSSVFGGILPEDPSAEALRRRLAQRKSVLDGVSSELMRLRSRLPGQEGQNLDYHLDAVRSLEKKLSDDGSSLVGCSPTAPDEIDFGRSDQATRTAELQMDVLVEALRCGARRVGVVQLGHSGDMFSAGMKSAEFGLDLGSRHEHVDLAHGWESQVADRVRLERVYYALFRKFLATLEAAKTADGSSLLDNTIVLWCKSLSFRHNGNDMLFMLAGGKNSGITKLGKYVDGDDRYQNDLLLSCLHLMGQTDSSFGNAAWNQGPIEV